MKRGLLIYYKKDYQRNRSFADAICLQGPEYGLNIELLLLEDLLLGVDGAELYWGIADQAQAGQAPPRQQADKPADSKRADKKEGELGGPGSGLLGVEQKSAVDFIINRTRLYDIGEHFAAMGARVFNPAELTRIANDKFTTHSFLAGKGIPSLRTVRYRGELDLGHIAGRPAVVKTVGGHGGKEVYLADEIRDLNRLEEISGPDLIVQEASRELGRDLRIFIMGGEIIGAVERRARTGFRANYSLGGQVKRYRLSHEEEDLVKNIVSVLQGDFYGIDFLISQAGLIFNEIEDVVGSRSLVMTTKIDIVREYLSYIKRSI